MALSSEVRPLTASVVASVDHYQWNDAAWMEERARKSYEPQPINVYELHLGSWKYSHGQPLNYREMAKELAHYCKEMGFTHVELLPVMEHPFDESWGIKSLAFTQPLPALENQKIFNFLSIICTRLALE